MFAALRRTLDHRAPVLAAAYRRVRDELQHALLPTYETRFGFTFTADAGLDVSREESFEAALLFRELATSAVLVDVGANAGLFTLMAERKNKPVIAVEPHPATVKLLLRNLRRNNAQGVEVYPVALSSAPGVMPLLGGGEGASLEHGWGDIESNYQTLVPVLTLDGVLGRRFEGERLFIKIDVEGHEHAVLEGAKETLARSPRPSWLLEHVLTENMGARLNPYFRQVFEVFWREGYQAETVERAPRVIKPEDVDRWLAMGRRDFGNFNVFFSWRG